MNIHTRCKRRPQMMVCKPNVKTVFVDTSTPLYRFKQPILPSPPLTTTNSSSVSVIKII